MTPSEEKLVFSETQSLCPECLKLLPAVKFAQGHNVYMKKMCPDHGEYQVVLWRGDPPYEGWVRPKAPSYPEHPRATVAHGCPFDCGLCPEHRQQTCTALLEVTRRCNLRCNFCFANADKTDTCDPDIATIRQWYESILETGGPCNIQLSGGEPTIRDDLPEIVALGRAMGFGFIQINTNGLRLGAEPEYLDSLKKAGLASVFLQFDGTSESVFRKLRGGGLLKPKLAAIEACRKLEIGVVLVPTVVPGVNDHELGSLVRFALDNLDVVRGVHFQPVSYFGRYPVSPSDSDRITIPEIIRNIEAQTDGMIKSHDFGPPGCENPYCSFHGNFVLMPDGELKSLTAHSSCDCGATPKQDTQAASKTRKFVAENWACSGNKATSNVQGNFSMGMWDVLLERVRTHKLCISGMAFQDVWNIDVDRLRDCCVHVVSGDGRIVPFCAYNLTSSGGRCLYGREGS